MDSEENVTRWVAITPTQSKTFLSEEEATDWIDDLWPDQPHIKEVKLMRVERYTSTIYRPRRATLGKRRK
jgi:hypothetical protein